VGDAIIACLITLNFITTWSIMVHNNGEFNKGKLTGAENQSFLDLIDTVDATNSVVWDVPSKASVAIFLHLCKIGNDKAVLAAVDGLTETGQTPADKLLNKKEEVASACYGSFENFIRITIGFQLRVPGAFFAKVAEAMKVGPL
jgi:hypothetical protein